MLFQQINPASGRLIKTWNLLSKEELQSKISQSQEAYVHWKREDFKERSKVFIKVAELLREDKRRYATLITQEMGKPITQAEEEVEKCAYVCSFYAMNAERYLSPEKKASEATRSYVRFDPLGIILGVMPWNFPFWQVFRFAVPAMMAGNTVLLKHAFNVPECSEVIEEIFLKSGLKEGIYQNLMIDHPSLEEVISDSRVQAVSLTGSESAGSSIASLAGKYIKPSVLELGGADPFIVLKDVENLKEVAKLGVHSRVLNSGQSCIAAKRFIVQEEIYEEFLQALIKEMESLKVGNPMDEGIDMGPLARKDLLDKLDKQVKKSLNEGARLELGGEPLKREGAYYPPTILSYVGLGQPAYHEELFGPVISLMVAKDIEDVIRLANDSPYGLGASIWTKDSGHGEYLASKLEAGMVFINSTVKSDPRVPFGGIKRSGYGRELCDYGIREFVNRKTIWVA